MKKSLYVLPHGIIVVGEYKPSGKNIYWRSRIRIHPLFDAIPVHGGMYVKRSRVVMTAVIGRKLLKSEHVHHINGDTSDDRACNLKIITPGDHNTHHKSGTGRSEETKLKISRKLKFMFASGLLVRKGLCGEDNRNSKLSERDVKEIRESNLPSRKLGKIYGVSKTNIVSIKAHKIWRNVK